MNPLIAIAASLFPEILKIIAGDRAGKVGDKVAEAVSSATGAQTPEAAKLKVDEDPQVAADLQVKLAQIALEVRKAEADAAARAAQVALENRKLDNEAEQGARDYERATDQLRMDATTAARSGLRELVQINSPIAWTPALLSYIVVIGFFLILVLMMRGTLNPAGTGAAADSDVVQIINICIGALTAAFATVMNYWLGSSLGSKKKDDALVTAAKVTQAREIARDANQSEAAQKKSPEVVVVDPGGSRPSPVGPAGPVQSWVGKMSHFGGPSDTGMAADEGLALFEPEDLQDFAHLFLDEQPAGTTGLGRRLNPSVNYIACRWDYSDTPRRYLRGIQVRVANPRTGQSLLAYPVDWGPNERTGRIADLSPGLASALGLDTDDVCQVSVPLPMSVAAKVTPVAGRLKVLSQAQIEETFGKFEYRELQGGRIDIVDSWEKDHIKSVAIPQLAKFNVTSVACHVKVAQALQDAFAEVERRGLLDRIVAWDGMFVPRHKTWNPARSLSSHSWAIAFDINARWNGYGVTPPPKGAPGSVVELVPIFEQFGFAWGGYFSGDKDGMHFEYCRTS